MQNKNYRNALKGSLRDCYRPHGLHSPKGKFVWVAIAFFAVTACAPVSLHGAEGQTEIRPERAIEVKRSDVSSQDLVCAEQKDMAAALLKAYGERSISAGLASTGYLLQIYAARSGSFTIVATGPNGISCIAADGQGWNPIPVAKPSIGKRS